ncbi:nucleoside triphosphate pyrophosphatase [Paracoccus sp. p4-l81]|uniref:Maf family protein n=1 Tax=Paracoccus sp. p4-l81 TaxID=3342806 RepID=UPI0035B86224
MLAQIGVIPAAVRAPDIDETPHRAEGPRAYVARMARQKAEAVALNPDEVVLCADTTVTLGRRILGKPEQEGEARAMLMALSGRRHQVLTAVALRGAGFLREKLVITTVRFATLTPAMLDDYIASGEWQGKAGAYGIQGRAGAFVPWLSGSFTGVVGLPLAETRAMLAHEGLVA